MGKASSDRKPYGDSFAAVYRMSSSRWHRERTMGRGTLAVTELKFDRPAPDLSEPLPYDDAFLVSVLLLPVANHELWKNGRPVSVNEVREAGHTHFFDLRQRPQGLFRRPSHVLHFYMPLATLNMFAEQENVQPISDFDYKQSVGKDDPVMRHLAAATLAAFDDRHAGSDLLLDSILTAASAHVLVKYGASARSAHEQRTYGLAAWQERHAKDLMEASLDISLADLARECGLSVSQFRRAFRKTTGVAPHQWLLGRRVERAKSLLTQSELPLAEIALTCGFASQSHFNSTLKRLTGISPGRLRRFSASPPLIAKR
ncbi:MAG: helix-turn-helix transcriptional regulator [Pseudolabrys sp.]|nr:helix-turn-helix transcriptional regulator [Pseudolabrys sp.]